MAFTLFSTCILYFQSVIFHEEHHPVFTWFTQCVTFNFFPSPAHEMAYNLFNVVMLYLLPLLIIIVSYSLLLYRISVKSREGKRPPVQGKELERVYKRCFKVRVWGFMSHTAARVIFGTIPQHCHLWDSRPHRCDSL